MTTEGERDRFVETIVGDVVDISFKDNKRGQEQAIVVLQQQGLQRPTTSRSTDPIIIQRMREANRYVQAQGTVVLGLEVLADKVKDGPGYYRTIQRISRCEINGVVQEPDIEDGPAPAPAPAPAPRQQQAPSAPASRGNSTIDLAIQQRIAWNSALNNTVAKTSFNEDEMTWFEYWTIVDERAHLPTMLIERGAIPDKEARNEWWASYLDAPLATPPGTKEDEEPFPDAPEESNGGVFEA